MFFLLQFLKGFIGLVFFKFFYKELHKHAFIIFRIVIDPFKQKNSF